MIVYRQAAVAELSALKTLLWDQGPNQWNYLTEEGVEAEFKLIEEGDGDGDGGGGC